MATLRLGTRGSALALVQARTVAALLRERTGTECEIVVIRTSGDRIADARLSEIGGKGLFVKEIEEALLAGTIDLAVHSSKDMPARLAGRPRSVRDAAARGPARRAGAAGSGTRRCRSTRPCGAWARRRVSAPAASAGWRN